MLTLSNKRKNDAMTLRLDNLSNVELPVVESILVEEVELWAAHLKWDYSATSEFLRNYIKTGLLPGVVLFDNEQAVGYAYFVVDNDRAIIGNIFVPRKFWGQGYEEFITRGLCTAIQETDVINRIESQIMLFSGADISSAFREAGFTIFPRNFLSLSLASWESSKKQPKGFAISHWKSQILAESSRLVVDSYKGTVDNILSSSFSTYAKGEEFVYNLVHRSGCGDFLPRITAVALGENGKVAGVSLATRLADKVGHLPQISVSPEFQGHGIGNYVVDQSLQRFKNAGYSEVSLTVTEENSKADSWYRRLGFEQVLAFNAYLWVRNQ
jgi:ribosomal protein S18 acetylase RimI-like enzyme